MKATALPALASATLFMSPVSPALGWQLDGRVVDESGEALAGAIVVSDNRPHAVSDDGGFRIEIAGRDVAILHIAADGYYDAVQAFHPSDFRGAETGTVRIGLVERRAERRLLAFAGDAMLARRYFRPRAGEPVLVREDRVLEDGRALLGPIRPFVEAADYASVNVETQLSATRPGGRLPKSVTFYSPPELADLLAGIGFDYAALGNNHTWDYQSEGLVPTLAALDDAGLARSGAGLDEAAARAPAVVDVAGRRHGFLSYVGWAGTFSPSQAADGDKGGAALGTEQAMREDLAALPADAVAVLQLHSGLEYHASPAGSVRHALRDAVDHGADVAIGHHPHVLQGFEIHRDRLIAYSLGNFLFDQYHYTTQLGALLYVYLDGDRLHRAEVVPLNINGYRPTPATGRFRAAVLNRLARLSQPLGTCLRENGGHAVIQRCAAAAPQVVDIGDVDPTTQPVDLDVMGLSATQPVAFLAARHRYRLGIDLLRRGDFESSGLFGSTDRAWIVGDGIGIVDGDTRELRIAVPGGGTVTTGMKVFERVFTPSTPTSVRGRIRADGDVVIAFRLQRRRPDDGLADALEDGPSRVVGRLRVPAGDWRDFSVDFDQPRVSTRAVRLLIDVRDAADTGHGASVHLDDLAWIQWQTPWQDGDGDTAAAAFATHVQFEPRPPSMPVASGSP